MGQNVLGFVLIAVVVGVYFAFKHGTGALERKLRPHAVERGDDLTTQAVAFEAPVDPPGVLRAVRTGLGVTDASRLSGGLFVADCSDGHLLLSWGSLIDDVQYSFLLLVVPDANGSRGALDLVRWKTAGYSRIVSGLDSLEAVRDQVRTVIAHLGGSQQLISSVRVQDYLAEAAPRHLPAPEGSCTLGAQPEASTVAEPLVGVTGGQTVGMDPVASTIEAQGAVAQASAPPEQAREAARCPRCGAHRRLAHERCPRCGAKAADREEGTGS